MASNRQMTVCVTLKTKIWSWIFWSHNFFLDIVVRLIGLTNVLGFSTALKAVKLSFSCVFTILFFSLTSCLQFLWEQSRYDHCTEPLWCLYSAKGHIPWTNQQKHATCIRLSTAQMCICIQYKTPVGDQLQPQAFLSNLKLFLKFILINWLMVLISLGVPLRRCLRCSEVFHCYLHGFSLTLVSDIGIPFLALNYNSWHICTLSLWLFI